MQPVSIWTNIDLLLVVILTTSGATSDENFIKQIIPFF